MLANLGADKAAYLTGRSFFPKLISPSFANGLHLAFDFAAATSFVAALASWLRGARYVHTEHSVGDDLAAGMMEVGDLAASEVGSSVVVD